VDPLYRHTQPGWVIVGTVGAVVALVAPRLPMAGLPLVAVCAVTLLLFGALTVELSHDQLRLWFGLGLVRRRIPLAGISAFRAVRNPWYCGWGIRRGPTGWLWNVSGLDAVELTFTDGRRFRVGTDEPGELVAALARVKGESASLPLSPASGAVEPERSTAWQRWPLVLTIGILGAVGAMIWLETRPPRVELKGDVLEVRGLVYGATVARAEVVKATLEPTLPRVLVRTNGFEAAGSLRGRFRVERLGEGRLFLERGHPPYLLLLLRDGFLVLGFRDAETTRALHDALARAWPERTVEPPAAEAR